MGDSSWWWFGSVYLVTNSPSHSTWPFQPPDSTISTLGGTTATSTTRQTTSNTPLCGLWHDE